MTLQTGHPRSVASNIKQAFNKSIYKGSQEITRKFSNKRDGLINQPPKQSHAQGNCILAYVLGILKSNTKTNCPCRRTLARDKND
jgi:hypothetical protein